MASKASWDKSERTPPVRLPALALAVIERAALLNRVDVVRLDVAERRDAETRSIAWTLLRDQLETAGLRGERLLARSEAWAAVAASLSALGLEPTPDDRYWRVAARPGSGAVRAAAYAACAGVRPEAVDPRTIAILLAPWQALRA